MTSEELSGIINR